MIVGVWTFLPLGGRAGGFALIDAADYDELSRSSWRAHVVTGYLMSERRDGAGKRHTVLMHRELLGLDRGNPLEVDHLNFDRRDNRRGNLRTLTTAQNGQHRRSHKGSTSRYRGVSRDKRTGRWEADVSVLGNRHWLGYFDDEDEAGEAAKQARKRLMPYARE